MEAELISHLRKMVSAHPSLEVPIGDDGAVVVTSPRTVDTVDMLTDGVDFMVGQVDPEQIGYKALAVNLSDLAAMAARPLAALISVALPESNGLELAKSIYARDRSVGRTFRLGDRRRRHEQLVRSVGDKHHIAGHCHRAWPTTEKWRESRR